MPERVTPGPEASATVESAAQMTDGTGAGATGAGATGAGATGSGATGPDTAAGSGAAGSAAIGSAAAGSAAIGSGAKGSAATGSGAKGSAVTGSGATGSGVTASGGTGSGATGAGDPAGTNGSNEAAPGDAAVPPWTAPARLIVDFAGEVFRLDPGKSFVVGREGDLAIDDNPYLHRTFLVLTSSGGMWWVTNAGSRTSATISDADSRMQAWLAPGARMPLVFARTVVWFTAGPTTYELDLVLEEPPYVPVPEQPSASGGTTIGRTSFTPDQLLLLLALAEPTLRRHGRGGSAVPSLAEAASRLGWTTTRLNRKLDNVCQKLTRQGVKGLHGGPDRLAVDRRSRLVEYALAARLVTADDLPLLDSAARAAAAERARQQ